MASASDTEYKTVRGLTRGLQLLNTLNRLDGGASTARLAELTGLHRTTVRRLLETLQDEGYVRRSESDDSYRLSLKVRELSEGFRDEQWISGLAAPLLAELMQEVVWPTDLCTLDVDAMVVRETTHRFSRLSFHRSMVGRRLPVLLTATGLAYLAFCPDAERERIIELLASRKDEESRLARDAEALDNLLRKTRHRGYGENFMGWNKEEKIASIAVPIRGEQRILGCLNLVYVAKAMSIEQAVTRYLPALRRAAEKIERGLLEQRPDEVSSAHSAPLP
jgi:IclR family mhp operon transcriptional activator